VLIIHHVAPVKKEIKDERKKKGISTFSNPNEISAAKPLAHCSYMDLKF